MESTISGFYIDSSIPTSKLKKMMLSDILKLRTKSSLLFKALPDSRAPIHALLAILADKKYLNFEPLGH
jgi:hypothetical protein